MMVKEKGDSPLLSTEEESLLKVEASESKAFVVKKARCSETKKKKPQSSINYSNIISKYSTKF